MLTLDELTSALYSFCAAVTKEREESHGVMHMNEVKNNAMEIWNSEKTKYDDLDIEHVSALIVAVALLHDVADHKYGDVERQTQLMENELHKYFSPENVGLIIEIIGKISYSKEAKLRMSGVIPTWDELGPEGRLVRNIVSDADKLEAIGVIGVVRCMQYTAEKLREKHEPVTIAHLVNRLVEHGHEKLFILKDEYIRTETGKNLAEVKHAVMMAEIDKLTDFVKRNPLCADPSFVLNEEEDVLKLLVECIGN